MLKKKLKMGIPFFKLDGRNGFKISFKWTNYYVSVGANGLFSKWQIHLDEISCKKSEEIFFVFAVSKKSIEEFRYNNIEFNIYSWIRSFHLSYVIFKTSILDSDRKPNWLYLQYLGSSKRKCMVQKFEYSAAEWFD